MTQIPFRRLAALGAVAALLLSQTAVPLQAQATINTTTLAAALSADSSGPSTISLASASTVAVGQLVYVDREAMLITSTTPTSTIFTVTRGYAGTARAAHASGAVAFTGPPNYFAQSEVAGACTATAEVATPRIVIASGNVYGCHSSTWRLYRRAGLPDSPTGVVGTTYTATGAITIEPGLISLNAAAVAMTLASPSLAQNGMVMTITSINASAHTVTTPAGFNSGGAARDVATFAAVYGHSFTIVASGGAWHVISAVGVTFA